MFTYVFLCFVLTFFHPSLHIDRINNISMLIFSVFFFAFQVSALAPGQLLGVLSWAYLLYFIEIRIYFCAVLIWEQFHLQIGKSDAFCGSVYIRVSFSCKHVMTYEIHLNCFPLSTSEKKCGSWEFLRELQYDDLYLYFRCQVL